GLPLSAVAHRGSAAGVRGEHAGRVPPGPGRGGCQRDLLPYGRSPGAPGPALRRLRRVAAHLARHDHAGREDPAHRRVYDQSRARTGPRAGAGGHCPGGGRVIAVDDYRRVAPPGAVDIILRLAEHVRGRRLLNVSGGRFGSGAAEILQAVVPMMTDLGVDAAWEITGGDPGFYTTTAALRAALTGAERALTDEALDHYVEMNRVNGK